MTDVIGNPVKQLGFSLDCFLVALQDNIPILYFRVMWQFIIAIF
jgi:hypothetical protein